MIHRRLQEPPYMQKTDRRNKSEQCETGKLENFLQTRVSKSDSPKSSDSVSPVEPTLTNITSSRRGDELDSLTFRDGTDSRSSVITQYPRRTRTRDSSAVDLRPRPINAESQALLIDPPRPAREGYEWVWFPQGYWAERKVQEVRQGISRPHIWRRRSSKDQQKNANAVGSLDSPPNKSPDFEICSIFSWPASSSRGLPSPDSYTGSQDFNSKVQPVSAPQKHIKGQDYSTPAHPHSDSSNGVSKGLYHKTKRGLESLSKRKKVAIDNSTITPSARLPPSRTTTTIEGTTSYLDQIHKEEGDQRQMLYPNDSQSSDSRTSRKLFGLAPWHRQDSYDTAWSVSSSIRELLMGKTPVSSPRSESPIANHKSKASIKVGPKAAVHVEQLPMEAHRVNTPPISGSLVGGRGRGFFFDLTPPHEDSDSDRARSDKEVRRVKAQGASPDRPLSSANKREREWWEVDIPVAARRGEMQPANFTLDIPEHLPSSPLCPMNPKHKSGGTGICVYHGRRINRGSSSDEQKLG